MRPGQRCPGRIPSCLLSPVFELVVEERVAADERYLPAGDEEVADACARFEDVAVGDDEVRHLALLDGAEAVGDAEYLRRVDGDGLERLVLGEPEGRGHPGVERQVA